MNTKELAAAIRNNRPALLIGKAGTAKTATVHKIAGDLGYPVETLLLAGILPEDLGGLVRPDNIDKPTCFDYLPPAWATKHGDDPFVLFLDEINQASIQTLHALFYIVNDRTVAGVKLPNMRIVAAGNGADENEFLTPLPAPLLDRFVYRIKWQSDVAASFDYLRNKYSGIRSRVDAVIKAIQKTGLDDVTPRHLEQLFMLIEDGTDTLDRGRELIGSAYDAYLEDGGDKHDHDERMAFLGDIVNQIKQGRRIVDGVVLPVDPSELMDGLTKEEQEMVHYAVSR